MKNRILLIELKNTSPPSTDTNDWNSGGTALWKLKASKIRMSTLDDNGDDNDGSNDSDDENSLIANINGKD